MNRRSFFTFGAKVVGAATLGAHIAVEKAQATTGAVDPGDNAIIEWQVVYEGWSESVHDGYDDEYDPIYKTIQRPAVARPMALPRGTYPPDTATWDGRSYVRAYVSVLGYSVLYRRT